MPGGLLPDSTGGPMEREEGAPPTESLPWREPPAPPTPWLAPSPWTEPETGPMGPGTVPALPFLGRGETGPMNTQHITSYDENILCLQGIPHNYTS